MRMRTKWLGRLHLVRQAHGSQPVLAARYHSEGHSVAFKRRLGVGTALAADRLILVDPDVSHFYGLDPVGFRVWQLLDQARTADEIGALLSTEYDAPIQVLQADTAELLLRLADVGLVERQRRTTHLRLQTRDASAVECFVGLAIVQTSLMLSGLPATIKFVEKMSAGTPRSLASKEPERALDLGCSVASRVARVAAVYPGRARCLEQSLCLYLLLLRRGLNPRLRIGVQPMPFKAHAWIELDGTPINDDAEAVRTLALVDFEAHE